MTTPSRFIPVPEELDSHPDAYEIARLWRDESGVLPALQIDPRTSPGQMFDTAVTAACSLLYTYAGFFSKSFHDPKRGMMPMPEMLKDLSDAVRTRLDSTDEGAQRLEEVTGQWDEDDSCEGQATQYREGVSFTARPGPKISIEIDLSIGQDPLQAIEHAIDALRMHQVVIRTARDRAASQPGEN